MNKKQSRLARALPWLLAALAYASTMLLVATRGRAHIDADMASEMVLANLLNQEGGLLSANWWYSTELRLFGLQLFYRPALMLFPQDWYAARVFGQGLWMLALIGAYAYMARGMGLKRSGAWGAAALACPFGAWYFWYGAYSGFYLPNMVLVLLALGAILRLLKPKRGVRGALEWAVLAAICLIAGLNSLKTLMALFIPLPIAAAIMAAREYRRGGKCGDAARLLGVSAVAAAIAGCGYLANAAVLAKRYSYVGSGAETFAELGIDGFLATVSRFFALFGYPADGYWEMNVRVLSVPGVLGAFGIVTATAIAVSLIRLLRRADALEVPQRTAPMLLAAMLAVQGLIFTMTGGWANGSYWLLTAPFAFPVLQLELETERFAWPKTRKIAALGLCACILATSASSACILFRHGLRSNPRLMAAAEWLDENGYTQGYATMWNGNVLTEWTSGRVEVWVTGDLNSTEPAPWLQTAAHAQPPEGRVFLLATREELEAANRRDWDGAVYADGEIYIFDFDSAADLRGALGA